MYRCLLMVCFAGLLGCDAEESTFDPTQRADAMVALDRGPDTGAVDATVDAAPLDAASDAASDAAPPDGGDAASPDAAMDAAVDAAVDSGAPLVDGGVDATVDAGEPLIDAAVDAGAPLVDGGVDAGAPLGPHGIDSFEWTCTDPAWMPGACGAGRGERFDSRGAAHVADDQPIEYDLSPPVADNHRGRWARWGEYRSLPPQRWLHNLEHGGVALLYHPCAPAEMVDALRDIARARGEDFRWILTPYADLQSAVAVVAWEWRYFAACVNVDEIELFIDQHYGMAPEDVGAHGGYEEEWIGQ